MKKLLLWFVSLVVLMSCDPPPCEVETYILDPIQKKLYLGIPDSTSYQQELLLKSIDFDTKIVYDTTFIVDSMVVSERYDTTFNCEILIDKIPHRLNVNDSLEFGNSLPGGTYSVMKLRVDRILYDLKAVDLSLWKYRFVQDCSGW